MAEHIFIKGRNILTIRDRGIDGNNSEPGIKYYDYVVNIERETEDISAIKIDISVNDIDNRDYDISYQIIYHEMEESNAIINTPGEVICLGSCACTAQTIKNCKVSKDLNLVNGNSQSRAQRLHEQAISRRRGARRISSQDAACGSVLGECKSKNLPNNFK